MDHDLAVQVLAQQIAIDRSRCLLGRLAASTIRRYSPSMRWERRKLADARDRLSRDAAKLALPDAGITEARLRASYAREIQREAERIMGRWPVSGPAVSSA